MKKIIVIAAIAALAACSKPAESPAADASAAPEPAAVAGPVAADGKSSVGTFKITASDGKIYTEVVKADGTYEGMTDGKVTETGKWDQKNPNLYCVTKDGEKEECNEEKIENGVWTSKNPEGKVSKVERVG